MKFTRQANSGSAAGALQRPRPRKGWTYNSLGEAKVDDGKREVKTILITEGPGNQVSKNYYTESFIDDVVAKYEGARAYLNHQTDQERRDRSEGDIRQLCGFYHSLEKVRVRDPKTQKMVWGAAGLLRCDETEAGREALAKAKAQIEYLGMFPESRDEYCGLSINGSGKDEGTVQVAGESWHKIVGVGMADSVDVVTRPARGGAFLALAESAGKAPTLTIGEDMKVRKVMALTAKITEATKKLTDATTDEARKAVEAEIKKLNKRLQAASKAMREADEAEEADESEEDEAEESEDDAADDAEDEDAEEADEADMKKLCPQMENEADEDYMARMTKIKAAFGGKKPAAQQESMRGLTADKLRKKFPKLFEAVAGKVRRSLEGQVQDITGLKKTVKALSESNGSMEVELTILRSTRTAEKLLEASKLPKNVLKVESLVGMTESEQKARIEETKALIEAVAGGRPINLQRSARSGGGGNDGLKSSIESLRKKAGVKTEEDAE